MKNLEYSKYASTQEKIRKTASDMMQKWVDKNGVEDRQKAIQFAKALSDKYGEAAASYACDMYDAIALSQNAKVPPAVPADTASWEEVGKAINGSLKQSIDGNLISGVVERLVKQAGEDTMLHNAARDRAEFAWIPDGGACAFCIMLASRGWQRASKDLLISHAEHIHANCGCEFAIRFDKNSGVKGYNPDALKKMYDEAAPGKSSYAKMKALRKDIEREASTKSNSEHDFSVKFDYKSDDFKNRLISLGENEETNHSMINESIYMLKHRDGTKYEDLIYIDSISGKYKIQDKYNVESEVMASNEMREMINKSEPFTIISIHNHPESTCPSITDLSGAYKRQYKYGIVIGHDGTMIKYKCNRELPDEKTSEGADRALLNLINSKRERLNKAMNSELEDNKKEVANVLNELYDLGIEMEIIK